MEVNIMDYLSEGEIRECIKEELKKQISNYINKTGIDTFISNISYINVFKKIDEEIPDFEIQIKEKVKKQQQEDSPKIRKIRKIKITILAVVAIILFSVAISPIT